MQAIATLLSHYWVGIEHAELRKRLLADWLSDVERFSDATIICACNEWRRSENRRPTPADIVKLCAFYEPVRQVNRPYYERPRLSGPPIDQNEVRDNWRKIVWPELTDAEKELFKQNLPRVPFL